jgi:hypothetical protein
MPPQDLSKPCSVTYQDVRLTMQVQCVLLVGYQVTFCKHAYCELGCEVQDAAGLTTVYSRLSGRL